MNITKNMRRVGIGALLGTGLIVAVVSAGNALATAGTTSSAKPSGVASTRTSVPTGVASTRTSVPTGKATTRTSVPTGNATTRTSVPTGKATTRTSVPTGNATTRTSVPTGKGSTWNNGDNGPSRQITVVGTPERGAEAGCLVLTAQGASYQLIGNPASLPVGRRVRVTGTTKPDMLTTCQEGTPLLVTSVSPA